MKVIAELDPQSRPLLRSDYVRFAGMTVSACSGVLHDAAFSAPERIKNLIDLILHVLQTDAAVHNEVSAGLFFRIRHLPPEQLIELLRAHSRPGKRPRRSDPPAR